MEVAKTVKHMEWKHCAYPFCTNRFYGSQFQRYCGDERCTEIRKDRRKKQVAEKPPEADNRILSKRLVCRALSMKLKAVKLKCKARDATGHICGKTFQVVLETKRRVYPKYCPDHANEYRRKLYNRRCNAKADSRAT